MAGVGIRLNKFFGKNSVTGYLAGSGYSIITTVAPMLLVIADILLMQKTLGYSSASYTNRQLFQVTILYVFVFSLIASAPLNAVLSRYVSDVIFNETYDDIMAAFHYGLRVSLIIDAVMVIPFSLHEYFVGGVEIVYILTSVCCFAALSLVFYTMLYLSLCKDYGKISLFYFLGMAVTFIAAWVFVKKLGMEVTFSMLLAMTIGFLIIASLGYALLNQYFTKNSRNYREVGRYIRKYWKLILANTLYTLGLFIHNFVFWTSGLRSTVANSFVYAETYDFASCIAMFTNISASVIFIAITEMHFNGRYRQYSEAVIGGRLSDIRKTKTRMFRLLAQEIMDLARIQFIISTVTFLICLIVLGRLGYSGTVIQLYPCLAAGYFILYLMYSAFLFLYFFNDLNGAVCTGLIFFFGTLAGSIVSMHFDTLWYGIGLVFGAFAGWTYAYFRLQWLEEHMHIHIFCNGTILKQSKGKRPPARVYTKRDDAEKGKNFVRKGEV